MGIAGTKTNSRSSLRRGAVLFAVMLALPALQGCGDEELSTVSERGVPGAKVGKTDNKSKDKKAKNADGKAAEGEAAEAEPLRPPVALDAKSFSRRRDPFQTFATPEAIVVPEPDRPRAERPVQMAKYAFENLKLIAIVNSGGMPARALFLASDGKSQNIKQGEYFSSAEVLLAAVNRDYVEIEVVDDSLAGNLNLQRGERRAIYLRNE